MVCPYNIIGILLPVKLSCHLTFYFYFPHYSLFFLAFSKRFRASSHFIQLTRFPFLPFTPFLPPSLLTDHPQGRERFLLPGALIPRSSSSPVSLDSQHIVIEVPFGGGSIMAHYAPSDARRNQLLFTE